MQHFLTTAGKLQGSKAEGRLTKPRTSRNGILEIMFDESFLFRPQIDFRVQKNKQSTVATNRLPANLAARSFLSGGFQARWRFFSDAKGGRGDRVSMGVV